jgi:hypothetical protein
MPHENRNLVSDPTAAEAPSPGYYEQDRSDEYARVVANSTGLSVEAVKQEWAEGRDPMADNDRRILIAAKRDGTLPSYIDRALSEVIGPDWADRDQA